jgi:Sulfotransferase family
MKNQIPILAFCHLRKAGGTAINQILRYRFGTRHMDSIVRFRPGTKTNQPFYTHGDLEIDRRIYPGLRSIAGHYLCPAHNYGPFGERFRWITILREPTRRYVSHYGQHVEKMGVRTDFKSWMGIEKYHNDQVKTLAGCENLDLAKQTLSRMTFGVLEEFDLSLLLIRELLPEFQLNVNLRQHSNSSKGIINSSQLLEENRQQIKSNNRLDLELYRFAIEELWPEQLARVDLPRLREELLGNPNAPSLSQRIRLFNNRLKRNLIYKPFVKLTRHGHG